MKFILLGMKRLLWFTPLLAVGLFHQRDKGFATSWETGFFRQNYFVVDKGLCNPPDDTLVDATFAHTGSRSARFECRSDYNDCQGSKRTDLKFPDNLDYKWFDFWIYLDSSYLISDPIPELFFQIHQRSDPHNLNKVPMGCWINNGRYQMQLQFFSKGYDNSRQDFGMQRVSADIGAVAPDANKWTHWTFHENMSCNEDGLWEVWKDGIKVYERHGPNYNLNQDSWYAKIGIYKWRWKMEPGPFIVNKRVWWLDDLKVGTDDNTIEDYLGTQPNKK